MEIVPIVLALCRRKTGAILIALQVALTLSIVSNSLMIIGTKLSTLNRATGIDEPNIVLIFNQWTEQRDDGAARSAADLMRLRALPEVVDAYATNAVPLGLAGTVLDVQRGAGQRRSAGQASFYMADSHALATLGIRLEAGRWFRPQEVERATEGESSIPALVVITRALAEGLFGDDRPVGKTIYLDDSKASTIIGMVERTVSPFPTGSHIANAVFAPYSMDAQRYYYVVRAEQGQVESVLKTATAALLDVDPSRAFGFAMPFSEWRNRIQKGDRAAALVLSCVSGLLLLATGLGIVGLSSYWVARRRHQIGIRRALGARRLHIVRYFQLENLVIMLTGVAVGFAGSIALNVVLAGYFEMQRLQVPFLSLGAFLIVLLGQLSALWPTLQAAAISPALAARSA